MKNAFGASSIAFLLLSSFQSVVYGWWDNGHMLVGEVASQLMTEEDRNTIHQVLSKWEEDFPNTNEISTAAIWSDLIKCSKPAPYCASPALPSLTMLDTWHYINIPINVNGTKWLDKDANLDLLKFAFDGGVIDVLEKSFISFKTTKSNWAANLLLRNFIHSFGDLHQPMHTVGGVSEKNPKGDLGGNLYKFRSPCAHSNLHALWDSAGGEYVNNWAPDMSSYKQDLITNGTAFTAWAQIIPDALNLDDYKSVSYEAFTKEMLSNSVLKRIALDTFAMAQDVAYKGLDLTFDTEGKVPCPSESYVSFAAFVSKQRITLGGKRLAVILSHFARQLRALGLAK